jgi:hypothetical protein
MKHPILLIALLIVVCAPFFLLWLLSSAAINVMGLFLKVKRNVN